MVYLLLFIPTIILLIAVLGVIALSRNYPVWEYRDKLISKIGNANLADIEEGIFHNSRKRWDYFESISYRRMIYMFWIPIDKFYDIKKFNFR